MFQVLVEFQCTIYLALAEQIKLLAAGGGWLVFAAFLPMGVVFGAAHALTPGHSRLCLRRIWPVPTQRSRMAFWYQ